MSREVQCTLSQLGRLIQEDIKQLEKRVSLALSKTANDSISPVRDRVPKAFGELDGSIHSVTGGENPKLVVDAPHAGDVEIGSVPHTPDFEKLLAWVKLRGLQGLTSKGKLQTRFKKEHGPTTPRQARRVASMFKSLEVRGTRAAGRHSPIGAPEQITRAISKGIEKYGTQPHWFVRNSLADIRVLLNDNMQKAVHG